MQIKLGEKNGNLMLYYMMGRGHAQYKQTLKGLKTNTNWDCGRMHCISMYTRLSPSPPKLNWHILNYWVKNPRTPILVYMAFLGCYGYSITIGQPCLLLLYGFPLSSFSAIKPLYSLLELVGDEWTSSKFTICFKRLLDTLEPLKLSSGETRKRKNSVCMCGSADIIRRLFFLCIFCTELTTRKLLSG